MNRASQKAYCKSCRRETNHFVRYSQKHKLETLRVLQCAGCESISVGAYTDNPFEAGAEFLYEVPAPEPSLRLMPNTFRRWAFDNLFKKHEPLWELITETYSACDRGLKCLAIMGMRSVLEHTMINKNGADFGSFSKNLDAFVDNGHISTREKEHLRQALEAGHGATHRFYIPTAEDLTHIFDIAENILIKVYVHPL